MTQNQDNDSPWKEILDGYFPEFMSFFFVDVNQQIDWSRGFESLDKELQKTVRDAELGRRYADKLLKVWLLQGQELWILIHVEVQAKQERNFARRMYEYHYRINDRYQHQVLSLAILADGNKKWRPNSYTYSFGGCSLDFHFPSIKLLDYADRLDYLRQSDNPFAIVVLVQVESVLVGNNKRQKLNAKLDIVRTLYEKEYSKKDILELFRFIDWMMQLPGDLELEFTAELSKLEEDKQMRYVTSIERNAIEQGMQQGMQQGEIKSKQIILARLLNNKLGLTPEEEALILSVTDSDELDDALDKVLTAQNVEEVLRKLRRQ